MGRALSEHAPNFDYKSFVALAPELEGLELKARVHFVRDELQKRLPQDFSTALNILLRSLESKTLKGFDLWPYTEFVQSYGLHEPEASLLALYKMTQLFTGEFAVRPFLRLHQKRTLTFLKTCASDTNVHVRRWVSEGSRPRLPWGERLDIFIKDPLATLPLLEKLKYDSELYVRKSVANHLNDISKDHPGLVIDLLTKWQRASDSSKTKKQNIQWITRHALRSLIKNADAGALKLMGAEPNSKITCSKFKLNKKFFKMNERIEFSFFLESRSKKSQKLIIDYIVHHVKSSGATSPKVFKLKTLTLNPGSKIIIKKNHSLKPITTRRYYAGTHSLEIQINGKIYAKTKWELRN